jgi:hypothetical protein
MSLTAVGVLDRSNFYTLLNIGIEQICMQHVDLQVVVIKEHHSARLVEVLHGRDLENLTMKHS